MIFPSTTKTSYIETRVDYKIDQEILTAETSQNAYIGVYI